MPGASRARYGVAVPFREPAQPVPDQDGRIQRRARFRRADRHGVQEAPVQVVLNLGPVPAVGQVLADRRLLVRVEVVRHAGLLIRAPQETREILGAATPWRIE